MPKRWKARTELRLPGQPCDIPHPTVVRICIDKISTVMCEIKTPSLTVTLHNRGSVIH